jgi:hypothetical protein
MDVMHELTPAEYLPDESLLAGNRNIELLGLANNLKRQEAVYVQQSRDPRMEQRRGARTHGVFVAAKIRKTVPLRQSPELLSILCRSGKRVDI